MFHVEHRVRILLSRTTGWITRLRSLDIDPGEAYARSWITHAY